MTFRKVRVLIIDDSASVRQALTAILSADPGIEVIAAAADPFAAARYIQAEVPDVITLDVEMPRMDGVTFLRRLMAQCPTPVVMLSARSCDVADQDGMTLRVFLEEGIDGRRDQVLETLVASCGVELAELGFDELAERDPKQGQSARNTFGLENSVHALIPHGFEQKRQVGRKLHGRTRYSELAQILNGDLVAGGNGSAVV